MSRAEGLFGPGSAAWLIDREVLILAGGTCALLMQLAHPAVAAGVEQHSDFRSDPFARLRRTLTSSFDVVFGSTGRAEAAIRRMNAIHGAVRGAVPETGDAYFARDPRLLLWVHATLIDTALRVYDRYVSPLTDADAQRYYAESAQIAVRLGVPQSTLPASLDGLRDEMAAMIASGEVRVSPTARSLAASVLYPTAVPPRFIWEVGHLVSMSVMPDELRRGYGIGWSDGRERGMRRAAAVIRGVLPLLPAPLRYVPQYRSALRRVAEGSAAIMAAPARPATASARARARRRSA
ncbi:MAG TPA: oxygenase MpaB family protein [Candidatus Limnocylindria bacterium]|nr:oxygenase MpaB family protein [Candidatus Limnocylindria bacterium]